MNNIIREIGSEFWDIPTKETVNTLFPNNTQWYVSGRSALKAIINDLSGCHSVAMPSWSCESMIKPFLDAGYRIDYYSVCWNEALQIDIKLDSDVLFIIDYFGFTSQPFNLNSFKGKIIRDVTHSIFSTTYNDAEYYFGSLRKWCGVWTGGYVWSKSGHRLEDGLYDDNDYIELRNKAMSLKRDYIIKGDGGKNYLKLFEKAENILDTIGVEPASNRDIYAANMLDVGFIKSRRRKNAEILRESFFDWLVFKDMAKTDCPLFVPVIVPNNKRNNLQRFLISKNIYCPVHWPMSQYHKLNKDERFIYDNEISLVCDQRYTETDMARIIDTINSFMK